jgi:hypothetical protein
MKAGNIENNRKKREGAVMKNFRPLLFAALLFLAPSPGHAAGLGDLRVGLIEGDVQIRNDDTGDWVPASINMPLKEGDSLWVPASGRFEIMLQDGTSLRLDENSSIEVLTVDNNSSQFYMGEGYAYINFRGSRGSALQLDTPVTSVRTYEKAAFKVEVERDSDTEVAVFKGFVYAESRSGKTRISGGKALHIKSSDTYSDLAPLGPVDDWERWNRDRDSKIYDRKYSSEYLPDELGGYSYDLNENGKWVYVSEYGYVWTPTVGISVDWAPYRDGRWTWIGGDYVWVGYESWGWVPYHYGRWISHGSYGWCWVPPAKGSVRWGPGYVGWVHTPTHVAWAPLAPGEIYYGYGNYGPNSVNIDINFNLTTRPYFRNAFVKNGVTTIHQDTFLRGKHVDVHVRENPFARDNATFGRPKTAPERIISRPVIKETPLLRQPPKPVHDIRIKELKSERPFVREQDRSVFKPEIEPKNMPVKILEEKKQRESRAPFAGVDQKRDTKAPVKQKPPLPDEDHRSKDPVKEKPSDDKPSKPGPFFRPSGPQG